MRRHLPLRHFFYEPKTDLGLSNSTHSPEETRPPWHQLTIKTLNKNLSKFVKYISPSSEDWTGVWFLRYRNLHLPFTCIGRENIVLEDKLLPNHLNRTQERLTKVPPAMSKFWAFVKKPKPEC